VNAAVYATPLYVARGPNPTSNEDDNIFNSAKPEYLMMEAAANTQGGYDGIYTIGINAPVGVIEPDTTPQGFKLEQNYPNPFNPTTKLKYSIPQTGEVKLAVFDLTGTELETLVDKVQSAGNYEVVFNAGKLSSGLYFYRISANGFAKTKEMLLIK
jgi:hypothetical protein